MASKIRFVRLNVEHEYQFLRAIHIIGAQRRITMNVLSMFAALLISASPAAQWQLPTPNIPRTSNGKANLSAPVPRTPDGKPDITGLWKVGPGYVANIAKDMKPEDVPYQPWAEALYKQRRETQSKD